MITIGIPVKDALPYVKTTLDSLQKNTIGEHEIIVVDDCSMQDTKEFLAGRNGIRVLTNEYVRGFPHNCNRIMQEAKYEKICLLNSDVYVPYGWNEKLETALDTYDIVGPSTCRAHGEQLLPDMEDYIKTWSFDEIEMFSVRLSQRYGMGTMQINIVSGFCFCLKKATIEKIGMFDEELFGLGAFEETDYCQTAREHDLKCAWVKGCYVHHFGHASFDNVKDAGELWLKNKQKFLCKHGLVLLPKVKPIPEQTDNSRPKL